jgi:hypothetical protein
MTDINQQIIALADQGLRAVDIAERLGLSITQTCNRMSSMTKTGELRRVIHRKGSAYDAKGRIKVLAQRYQMRIGNVGLAMMQLDMAQAQWLFEQTPQGMTIAEYLISMAKDAYAEDNGDE